MSLKPIKKSDANKVWMQKRKSKVILISPEHHLIVSEGTKTEPAYFKSIREIINKRYKDKIQVEVEGMGNNTVFLFKKAQKFIAHSPTVYQHVWIVYDTDDFPPQNVDAVCQQCKEHSNEETTYHAVWSNQCIELWFLLHFMYCDSDLHRYEYYPKLSQYLGIHYEKNLNNIFDLLYPHVQTAIKNAKKLANIHSNKTPSQSAPATQMYQLIELLYPYFKQ